ncbi:MAG: DUF1700 domain-containing protein [Clostridiales bacterium]|nr:DUF1700 domain-containing protein [Clostridiales bacterium]
MDKQTWLDSLRVELKGLPQSEIEDIVQHYSESYDERVEQGVDKDEALRQLGDYHTIAQSYKSERAEWVGINSVTKHAFDKWPVVVVVLLVVGAPLYLGVLAGLFGGALGLLIGVVVVAIACFVSLVAFTISGFAMMIGSLYGIVTSIVLMQTNQPAGLAILGSSIAIFGAGIALAILSVRMTQLSVKFAKWAVSNISKGTTKFIGWVGTIFNGRAQSVRSI